MKRARDSSLSETRVPGLSITNLPSTIFIEILLRLPVKSIVMCKSVCKAWYGSISDPQFVKLHLARARSCALIRGEECWKFLRSLYLLEPEDERGSMLHKRSVRMKSRKDHCYEVMNSSNGFLCLTNEDSIFRSVCVCNPVTGEFMCPPDGCDQGNYSVQFDVFGFGFSPKHNQYKVIRMSTRWKDYADTGGFQGGCAMVVEIHNVGSDSWRSLDISGSETPAIDSPSYLNGALYWTCRKDKKHYVASFDFDQELFNYFPKLPSPYTISNLGTKILEGRLILYTNSTYSGIDIWALNEYGNSFSCTKMFTIDFDEYHDHHMWYPYQPVCCLTEEAAVLFGGPHKEFIHYDRTKGIRFKRLKFQGYNSKRNKFKVIDFTPSFVSLKDVVSAGSNVEVLNVNSRYGNLSLDMLFSTVYLKF